MICIAIAQDSRRMALVDMLNAANQCDLLEVRLDRFGKPPDIHEVLARKPKPVIFSCRRPQDGGEWRGTEEERLTLLRQCIVSKADYVEIELDVADQIRKFPPAKRVICYTNLQKTPRDIAQIYAQAQTKNPDIIKLVTLARTPEEAWPLVQILSKPSVPTVVVGLGKPGIMLSILGKKIGAPWTYAALEKGMEAYPDQPTVRELSTVYHYPAIERSTRFIGVTGFGAREYATVAALNAVLASLGLPMRCLPLGLGSVPLFRKVMDAVKFAGVIVDEAHREEILAIASERDPATEEAGAADLLLAKEKNWHAHNTTSQAAFEALEELMRARAPSEKPLQGRVVMVVGANASARTIGLGLKLRGAVLIIASKDRAAGNKLAQILECRSIQFEALYSNMHDVLVVCDQEKEPGQTSEHAGEPAVHAGYLKSSMFVMDVTPGIQKSPLLHDAKQRGCAVVSPRQLLEAQLRMQARLITGQDVPSDLIQQSLSSMLEEEES
jgi:3-dehydroquinate dehydratase/shikimate dehydrogenase